jgi:ribosomal protein S18 acetylase RimI-like enzyme
MREIDLQVASTEEARHWQDRWRERTEQWYRRLGATGMPDGRLEAWAADPGAVIALRLDGATVGTLAVAERDDRVVIYDIWVDPEHRGTGVGRAARTHAERIALERGTDIFAITATADPAALALFTGYPLRAQKMVKALDPPVDGDGFAGSGWRARPMREEEYDPWLAEELIGYADDVSGSGLATPAAAAEQSEAAYRELLPDRLASPGYTWWTIETEDSGNPVAWIWLAHGRYSGLSFVYSVSVAPQERGRGYGKAAMLVGEAASLAAGDRFLALNVFGHNHVAMRLYDRLGYAVVEQTRSTTP